MDETGCNKRIEFIDSLRGFVMLLIVLVHVAGFCFNIEADVPSIHFFVSPSRTTLPLFFFICGFVMYKEYSVWTIPYIKNFIFRKAKVLILGTSIFFLTYLHLHEISISEGILSDSKCGYWFTFILFFYYTFYIIIQLLCRRLGDVCTNLIHLCFGACLYVLSIHTVLETLSLSNTIIDICGMQYWGFYFFLILGTLARKYYAKFEYYIDHKPFLFICLCLYFIFNIFSDIIIPLCWNLFCLVIALTGIIIAFSFFRKYESALRKDTKLGKILQFVGRRTLDIYFIHYFFLPVNAVKIITIFHDYPMPVVECVVSLSITIAIIAFCLLLGTILRLSPEISYWIFGVKK